MTGNASPKRIVVNLPAWIGDCVMATPALRALREHYRDSHITYLLMPYVAGVVQGLPWHDDLLFYRGRRPATGRKISLWSTVKSLRAGNFDLGVLLNNSFREALLLRLGKVRRRVGYDRDGRGLLLTDRLLAYSENGRFLPQPMVRYYMGAAHYLGCRDGDLRPRLALTGDERAAAATALARHGVAPGAPYVVLNPGAAFGSAKMWPPERFAAVADVLAARGDRGVVIVCGPQERPIARAIHDAQKHRAGTVNFMNEEMELGTVKAVIAGSRLLITNDSGLRHFGIAFDVPVVTIFGPTDPEWTECDHPKELQLRARVPCGPCMLRRCPIDHRCMKRITPELVVQAADALAERFAGAAVGV
jgi:heptosyltransferase-2